MIYRFFAALTIVGLANHTVLIARDGTERAIDDSAALPRPVAATYDFVTRSGRLFVRVVGDSLRSCEGLMTVAATGRRLVR